MPASPDKMRWSVTLPDGTVRQIATDIRTTAAVRALRSQDSEWLTPCPIKWPGVVAKLRALGFEVEERAHGGRWQVRLGCAVERSGRS